MLKGYLGTRRRIANKKGVAKRLLGKNSSFHVHQLDQLKDNTSRFENLWNFNLATLTTFA